MELDWTTFLLQILNFLVLVWLLKRFLYKPVFAVIAERKVKLDQVRAESERLRQEGEALRARYERRLTDWEREKEKAREQLLEQLRVERTRSMEELRLSLEQEREKAQARSERERAELQRRIEEQSLAQGARFAARLLECVATPELEARIVAMTCDELRNLTPERRKAIVAVSNGESPLVMSAYPLDGEQRAAVSTALQSLTGRSVECRWSEAPEVVAGLHISIGPWVLGANVRDELNFFVEAAHADRRAASA